MEASSVHARGDMFLLEARKSFVHLGFGGVTSIVGVNSVTQGRLFDAQYVALRKHRRGICTCS